MRSPQPGWNRSGSPAPARTTHSTLPSSTAASTSSASRATTHSEPDSPRATSAETWATTYSSAAPATIRLFGDDGVDQLFGNGGNDYLEAEVIDAAISAGSGAADSLFVIGESKTVLLTNTTLVINGTTFANHGAESISLSGSAGLRHVGCRDILGPVTY